jgi:hypothetical protein
MNLGVGVFENISKRWDHQGKRWDVPREEKTKELNSMTSQHLQTGKMRRNKPKRLKRHN